MFPRTLNTYVHANAFINGWIHVALLRQGLEAHVFKIVSQL